MATGGHVVHHDRGETPVVRTPPSKATGDVSGNPAGFAQASPFFKKLEQEKPKSKADEKKAIAEASTPVKEDEKKKEQEKA